MNLQFTYSKSSIKTYVHTILLTALGTVLLTSEALGIFEGSSLFAQFFFSENKCQKVKQCKIPAQYKRWL
jgi:hypothetical protein